MDDDYDNLRPISGENRYAEWDEEFDCWGVFGEESGFCYSQHENQEEAEVAAS